MSIEKTKKKITRVARLSEKKIFFQQATGSRQLVAVYMSTRIAFSLLTASSLLSLIDDADMERQE